GNYDREIFGHDISLAAIWNLANFVF
ncbi:MAG: hypothetical protein UU03_C0015G0006, partial [Candidatus Woesebacteria bacterium GW2011_GWA1_40_45]